MSPRQPGPYGPIQLYPPGLLGFLQLKHGGENPSLLGDTYIPSLELREWLLQQNSQNGEVYGIALATGAGLGRFSPTVPIVPANEYWWVQHYTIHSPSMGAGDSIGSLLPVWIDPTTGTLQQHWLGDGIFRSMGGAGTQAATGARNFFLPPGAELGFRYSLIASTTISLTGYVRYTPLPT